MKIKRLKAKGFKRFSDLTVEGLSPTVKLVVLTGPNGSGKTSLFEAFNFWISLHGHSSKFSNDPEYYAYQSDQIDSENTHHSKAAQPFSLNPFHHKQLNQDKVSIEFFDESNERLSRELLRKAFYIRSSYRHSPTFSVSSIEKFDTPLNDPLRGQKLILPEDRVEDNYKRIVNSAVNEIFDDSVAEGKTRAEIRDGLIGEIRSAMGAVFNDLTLEGPGHPLESGTFRFTKGSASNFHYKNLSSGEKAAFDILLDFVVKRKVFDDTIYCIDEPELHMHTHLQSKLLGAMFDLIPDNCQLWISTHSIGMARKASELNETNPESVAFIDFHDHDFDAPIVLQPRTPDRGFWSRIFDTALDDLAHLVVPQHIVFCEGKPVADRGRKPSFDAEVYKTIFAEEFPHVEFISLGGAKDVTRDGVKLGAILKALAPGVHCWNLIDRDDHHETDIEEFRNCGTIVLKRRDIESYLWDDEVLRALCDKQSMSGEADELIRTKHKLLENNNSGGAPHDDIKAISGMLYNECRRRLNLIQCGNDAEAFAIRTLAPLIKPGTEVYKELRSIIMDRIPKS